MDPERYPCNINSICMCVDVNRVDRAAKIDMVQDFETGFHLSVGELSDFTSSSPTYIS
jgi:hypothetical protein